jgi:hypothetical protein
MSPPQVGARVRVVHPTGGVQVDDVFEVVCVDYRVPNDPMVIVRFAGQQRWTDSWTSPDAPPMGFHHSSLMEA